MKIVAKLAQDLKKGDVLVASGHRYEVDRCRGTEGGFTDVEVIVHTSTPRISPTSLRHFEVPSDIYVNVEVVEYTRHLRITDALRCQQIMKWTEERRYPTMEELADAVEEELAKDEVANEDDELREQI